MAWYRGHYCLVFSYCSYYCGMDLGRYRCARICSYHVSDSIFWIDYDSWTRNPRLLPMAHIRECKETTAFDRFDASIRMANRRSFCKRKALTCRSLSTPQVFASLKTSGRAPASGHLRMFCPARVSGASAIFATTCLSRTTSLLATR